MVRANEIAVLPLVLAGIEQGHLLPGSRAITDWSVVLRNIGKSPALFVEVEEFNIENTELGKEVWRIEGKDVIEGEQQATPVESFAYVADSGTRLADSLGPLLRDTAQAYRIRILYEDIAGGKHESLMQMGKGGIRLLSHR